MLVSSSAEIVIDRFADRSLRLLESFIENNPAVTQRQERGQIVADKKHGPPALSYLGHLAKTLLLELRVAHRQHFIHDQDLRFQVRATAKASRTYMPLGVPLHRRIEELLHFRESHDLVELP